MMATDLPATFQEADPLTGSVQEIPQTPGWFWGAQRWLVLRRSVTGKWTLDGKQELEIPLSEYRGIWQAFKTWVRILHHPPGSAILFTLSSPIPHGHQFAKHVLTVMNEYKFGDQIVKALTPLIDAPLRN